MQIYHSNAHMRERKKIVLWCGYGRRRRALVIQSSNSTWRREEKTHTKIATKRAMHIQVWCRDETISIGFPFCICKGAFFFHSLIHIHSCSGRGMELSCVCLWNTEETEMAWMKIKRRVKAGKYTSPAQTIHAHRYMKKESILFERNGVCVSMSYMYANEGDHTYKKSDISARGLRFPWFFFADFIFSQLPQSDGSPHTITQMATDYVNIYQYLNIHQMCCFYDDYYYLYDYFAHILCVCVLLMLIFMILNLILLNWSSLCIRHSNIYHTYIQMCLCLCVRVWLCMNANHETKENFLNAKNRRTLTMK